MAATRLQIYQDTIRLFGDARLDLISDDTESRYALDDAFPGVVDFCLRAAAWRFALKTQLLAIGGGSLPGFTVAYSQPADWLRTHALFVLNGELERPIDIREQGIGFSSNHAAVNIRFVSSDYADPELTDWPEHFSKAVAAYLAFSVSDRLTNSAAAGVRMTQIYGTLMQEAILHDALPEDPWLRFQLDGRFQEALFYVLLQGYWRFALTEVRQDDLIAGLPGPIYTSRSLKPNDWVRTHALFIPLGDNLERPFDIRERRDYWDTDTADFVARYVSTTYGIDPLLWPEPFLVAVLAYLTPAPPPPQQGRQNPQAAEVSAFSGALAAALAVEAEPENPWLRNQLDGSFQEAVLYVLKQGYWDFALKTIEFSAAPITAPPPTTPIIGYPYSYPQPDDMLRSQAFFVPAGDGREYPIDIKEDAEQWSTTANYFAVRYVSSERGLRPAAWQEPFLTTVLAYLNLREGGAPQTSRTTGEPIPAAAGFRNVLQAALIVDATPENPWYRFQRNGAFLRACFHVAETGRWKFAINTLALEADAWVNDGSRIDGTLPANVYGDGSISPSYAAVFAKPADWLKTIWIYRIEKFAMPSTDLEGWPERYEVDYRDELGNWHANWRNIQVRYIRRAALESWRWPQSYADAVLAWLEYEEARTDPKATAIAAAKQKIYEDMVDKAAKSDDMAEFPPYRRVGHLVRGRFYRSRGTGAQNFLGPR